MLLKGFFSSAYVFQRLTGFIIGKVLPKMAYPVLWGPLKGALFILGSAAGERGGASIYFNQVEPEKTRAFVKALSPGQVFFDIGANVGYYTLLGSRLVGSGGKVFAFEPVVRNLAYLYRHIVLNKANNITIIPAACFNRLTIADFFLGDNCAVGHLHLNQVNREGKSLSENTVVVPTVTVDEVVKRTRVFPDMIKIDVEGAEFEVLQGACNTLIESKPVILLAVHSSDLQSACINYLKGMGYFSETVCSDDHGDVELLLKRA